ncbi:MAG: TrmH family RNA methyltransferase [Bacteroidota bacterium]
MPISQRLKKLIRSLHQKQYRDQNGLFVAEGERLCSELVQSDYIPEIIVIKDSPSSDILESVEKFADKGIPVYTAPKHQFDQICDTKNPQGILAVVNDKEFDIMPDESFLALDGIADPGNVGTIIRTAEWFGIKQVFLGRDCADRYSPKTVRSTMGSIFRTHVIEYPDLRELISSEFDKFEIYGAALDAGKSLKQIKHGKKFGIVFGSEAHGISEELTATVKTKFRIEGNGSAESLNVATSVGISLYHFMIGPKS